MSGKPLAGGLLALASAAHAPGAWAQTGNDEIVAQLLWESPGADWNASLLAKNIIDAEYFTVRLDLNAGGASGYSHLGEPLTFGVTLGRRW